MRTGEDLEGWEETGQSEFSVGGSDSLCECGTWLMVVNLEVGKGERRNKK